MRIVIFMLVFLFSFVFEVFAQIEQTVEISSSPNPVGSGARALGMGGAFIGVADDATAASWNPAGLIQLETPEVSIVGAYSYRREDTLYRANPEASGPQDISTFEINYLSIAYPFSFFNKNMVASLNIQHLYDFNKKANYIYVYQELTPPALILSNRIEYNQEGSFKPISPAFAIQVTPYISLGLTINFWEHFLFDNQWESGYRSQGAGTLADIPFTVQTNIYKSYMVEGLRLDLSDPFSWYNMNYHLGLLWQISNKINLGIVFKAPFEAHLKHQYDFTSTTSFNTANHHSISEEVILHMPKSYGFGLAYRFNDVLTLDIDIYRTEWSKFILYDGNQNELNPITGKFQKDSNIDDTTQIRLGGEYLFILSNYAIPLRAGLFYDPEPAEPDPDNFFGISIGTGIAYKKFIYDIAYQYRFGRDVRSITVGSEDSSQDVDQHTIYMSLIYHF